METTLRQPGKSAGREESKKLFLRSPVGSTNLTHSDSDEDDDDEKNDSIMPACS